MATGSDAVVPAASDDTREAIYQLALDGRFVHGNAALSAITGYDLKKLRRLNVRDVVHPDDRSQVEEALASALDGRHPRFPMRWLHKDGSVVSADATTFPVQSEKGTIIAIAGIARDREPPAPLQLEQRLRSALDRIQDSIAFIDRDWRVSYLNHASMANTGLTMESAAPRTVWELFPELDGSGVGALYRRAMEHGESGTVRSFTTQYGRWFEVAVSPTADGIAAVVRDVTEEEERGQQIAAYTSDLEAQAALIEATADAMIVTALDGTVESWNRAAEEIYGWPRGEALGRSIRDLTGDVSTADDERRSEIHPTTRGGRQLTVERRRQLLEGVGGTPDRILYVDTDITEHFADRAAARALELRLQDTLDQITDGLAFYDRDWRVTFVNNAGWRIMQRPRDASLGQTLWDLYPDLWPTDFGIAYRRTMDDRVVSSARGFYAHLDAWFDVTSYPTDEGILIYFKDVTQDEVTRQSIEAQNRRLRDQATLLDVSRDAMIVYGLDHVIRYWNAAASELYGWPADEAVGRSLVELLHSDTSEYDRAYRQVVKDGWWRGELRPRRRDGKELVVEARWQLVRHDDDTPATIFAVNTDVTELRKKQAQAIRDQRMESLGTLAGGIAHDLNNVLTPILMSVQLLKSGEQDAARLTLLETMDAGVKRGADMIRQVLSFARGIEGAKAIITIEGLLEDVVAFCRDTLPKSISAEVTLDTPLWKVVGDRTQLMQVLINLVTNARDAMPDGGAITIRARNVELGEQYQAVTNLAPPGRYVAIDIEDAGEGMTSETLSKIFEPFFTTKPQGTGTGLGLPTSMAIVRSHGGYIQVYSEPGNGSRFQLHLPAADHDNAEAVAAEPMPEIEGGRGERILVIDDEAAIRQIVSQTLTANGYEALVASNGREAIEIIEAAETPIDLVLTDMMMPVMDGAATARYLIEHHPEIAIVAASGLNANGGVARVKELGVSRFISKPFTTDGLLGALREALDGR